MPLSLVNIIVGLAGIAAATVLGMFMFFVGSKLAKIPGKKPGDFLVPALFTSLVSVAVYSIVLGFIDNTQQDLINGGFLGALLIGLGASYVVGMKNSEATPEEFPKLWIPYAIGLVIVLFLSRTQGDAFRASHGYFRGFEKMAARNLLDDPEAMSTPEKAINYYNRQYGELKTANEDKGLGKILQTVSVVDAKWFNDYYDSISASDAINDMIGLSAVVTDPNAHKFLALLKIARPAYGSVETVKEMGSEALVRMTTGQVVWLVKEGSNWKVRDWLGMRSYMMSNTVIEHKKRKGTANADDEKLVNEVLPQEQEHLRKLHADAGFDFRDFNPWMYDDEDERGIPGATALRQGQQRPTAAGGPPTGYNQLDQAAPGQLVDLSGQQAPAPQVNGLEEGTDMAGVAPEPQQVAMAPEPQAYAPVPEFVPPPDFTPAPTPFVGQMIALDISVDPLWPRYFAAVKKIEDGDASGVQDLLKVVSNDDSQWMTGNALHLLDMLLAPGDPKPEGDKAPLLVAQALLRNMPDATWASVKPVVRTKGFLGIAEFKRITEDGQTETFRTALVQENGRWVIAHLFFTRDFVWLPQLANYKLARQIMPTPDEVIYIQSGFVPFQQRVQTVYGNVGYGG